MAGKELTYKKYNLDIYDPFDVTGPYEMPIIHRCDVVPESLIGFNEVLSCRCYNHGVHMFIDDYQFERLWNHPKRYVNILKRFECVFSPDFSLYMDMPMAMKVWNTYRSRMIGQFFQKQGIKVIPTVSWAEPGTYDFCFDGIEKGSIVAVSTTGCIRDDSARNTWIDGMEEMIDHIHPSKILAYGQKIDFEADIEVIWYGNHQLERVRKYGR
ncbi:DUF4417 domain-containing protein [Absicoccus porci]|nr:DUF4417 domain-containing protein [Absicoccus porci]